MSLFRNKWPRNGCGGTLRGPKSDRLLGYQPGIGRPIEDMPDEFREWLIDFGDSGYVARYRIDADAVTILAVRHQKEVGF